MKYIYNGILFQEIPDEITIGFTLLGCTRHCKGCHSSKYWDINLDPEIGYTFYVTNIIRDVYSNPMNNAATTVCFFGGDWNCSSFFDVVLDFKYDMYRNSSYHKYKLAWYTGLDEYKAINDITIELFNYIKVGEYNKELGGLRSKTTNQKLFKTRELTDITSRFWREE